MKSLVLASSLLVASLPAFATMEASWQNDPTSEVLGSTQISCPTYIFVSNDKGDLVEKVWSHELKRHASSAIDTAECVYR